MLRARAYPHPFLDPSPPWPRPAEPFRSVEQAWFWTIGALRARHEGACRTSGTVLRPCEPDDVIVCLDNLYRRKRIDLSHARVLRVWGERGMAPDARLPAERTEARLWGEAMDLLDWPLRVRGIVADRQLSRKKVVDDDVIGR
jgi:hypothetical protein